MFIKTAVPRCISAKKSMLDALLGRVMCPNSFVGSGGSTSTSFPLLFEKSVEVETADEEEERAASGLILKANFLSSLLVDTMSVEEDDCSLFDVDASDEEDEDEEGV